MGQPVVFKNEAQMPPLPVSVASTLYNKTGTWRYIRPVYMDKTPPCVEACPAGEDIEGYMYLVARGRFEQAWELIMEENPLPAVCGRVCYHPCEGSCNRGEFDQPLAINAVERVIGDYGLDFEAKRLRLSASKKEKIAVVGSGPAGLTCAYHLARLGYKVTLFEALPQAGGVLRIGIPKYRLPKDVLDKEISRILSLGVELRSNVKVGQDIPWRDMRGFDALFIAIGVHQSRKLNIPGEDLKGVISGLEFLRAINMGEEVEIGERVVVIGGGNTAMDAARSVLRLGRKPTLLYRRTRAEMPAIEEEIEETLKEGIKINYLVSPVKIIGENGRVRGLECIRMRLGQPDQSGRRRPIPIEGSNFIIDVDTVITAVGEIAQSSFMPEGLEIQNGVIKTDGKGATNLGKFFAGGDIIDQPHTVVHAIGSGKRAAMAIDCFLRGESLEEKMEKIKMGHKGSLAMRRYLGEEEKDNLQVVRIEDINLDYFEESQRQRVPQLKLKERVKGFDEINIGFSRGTAIEEAQRCFNCGVCNMCDNCFIFCPDLAISKREDDHRYQINYDYCKGCGICAEECPRNAISMVREGE